eukprot:GFUD01046889.1.p1 GENE.GFUD01046889.1~~GFUD01046889.1.p1  ORF type:complete len:131 (-),score=20.15 GFUD01046889.1:60-452(-)
MCKIFLVLSCLLATTQGGRKTLGGRKYNLDEMAASACVGISLPGYQTVVAVRRQCGGVADCTAVCENADPFGNGAANGGFTCFNSLHVYNNRPILGKYGENAGKYGPIIHKYGACGGGCGPNYCCCKGHN